MPARIAYQIAKGRYKEEFSEEERANVAKSGAKHISLDAGVMFQPRKVLPPAGPRGPAPRDTKVKRIGDAVLSHVRFEGGRKGPPALEHLSGRRPRRGYGGGGRRSMQDAVTPPAPRYRPEYRQSVRPGSGLRNLPSFIASAVVGCRGIVSTWPSQNSMLAMPKCLRAWNSRQERPSYKSAP